MLVQLAEYLKEYYSGFNVFTYQTMRAIMGALTLYLDFINLFLFLLRFLGNRE